jgi:uncharacterized protein YodC (DUF2158 family)
MRQLSKVVEIGNFRPGISGTAHQFFAIMACCLSRSYLEGGVMKTSWQSETGRLECRWFEGGHSVRQTDLEDSPENKDRSFSPSIPDFACHSPLGSGEWFAPWSARWILPGRI